MARVAAQDVATFFMLNSVATHITTGTPESNASCRLHVALMEGAWHVGGGLCVAFFGGASPEPAVIWTLDVHLHPEVADGPIHVEIKVGHIDGATPLVDLLHAVQTFSHESKVALVLHLPFVVPGAAEVSLVVQLFFKFSCLLGMSLKNLFES